jgi:hypothetical protein
MSQIADDLSVSWYQACDQIKSLMPSLSVNQQVWICPSVESALIEIAQSLLDRNSEMGHSKTHALLCRGQDPALDVLASIISGSGLSARFVSLDELNAAEGLAAIKPDLLFSAYAGNSRFTGETFDISVGALQALSSGAKSATIRIGFEQFLLENYKPAAWDVFVHVLWSGASVVFLGERLRFASKAAPYNMPRSLLHEVVQEFKAMKRAINSRTTVEAFEAALPSPFRPLHPAGSRRMLDRVIFSSDAMDGSFVCDRLMDLLTEEGVFHHGDCMTTSLCWSAETFLKRSDERRLDWLLKNCRVWISEFGIRGTVSLPVSAIERIGAESLLTKLASIVSSHK